MQQFNECDTNFARMTGECERKARLPTVGVLANGTLLKMAYDSACPVRQTNWSSAKWWPTVT